MSPTPASSAPTVALVGVFIVAQSVVGVCPVGTRNDLSLGMATLSVAQGPDGTHDGDASGVLCLVLWVGL